MLLLSVADHYNTRTFSFTRGEVVIGSAPDADLVLDKEGVGGRHLRIARRGNELHVDDLLGRHPSRVVESGARLRVGGVELRVVLLQLAPEGVVDDLERSLLDEIRDRPADGGLREVYADWLDEHGQAARAEFLRVQLAVSAATSARDPAFLEASARLAVLAREVGAGWRARVAMAFIERCAAPRQAVGFELVCPMRWDKLAPTEREGVRSCGACRREVTYCTTIDQARTVAQEGGCIAVDLELPRRHGDLSGPMMVGRPSPPLSRYGRRSS